MDNKIIKIIEKKEKIKIVNEEEIEAIKYGDFKLMESKGGEILPNIVNHKNKIVKQVRLEEVKQKLDDKKVDKLGEYALEQKLDAIREQIEEVVCLLEDICIGDTISRP